MTRDEIYGTCPSRDNCCDEPETFTPEHECDDETTVCEECYRLECENCGNWCYCEL